MDKMQHAIQSLGYKSATFPVELKDMINIILVSSKHYSTSHAKFVFSHKTHLSYLAVHLSVQGFFF